MRSTIFGLILLASFAPCCGAVEALGLDTPLHFSSAHEIYSMSADPPYDVHPAIGEALTYLCAYASREGMSNKSRDALVLTLCEGRTPRQMITLGFVLRLEVLRRAVVEDELRIALKKPLSDDETFSESLSLYELRITVAKAGIDAAQKMIAELTEEAQPGATDNPDSAGSQSEKSSSN